MTYIHLKYTTRSWARTYPRECIRVVVECVTLLEMNFYLVYCEECRDCACTDISGKGKCICASVVVNSFTLERKTSKTMMTLEY